MELRISVSKILFITSTIIVLLILFLLLKSPKQNTEGEALGENIVMEDGKQILTLRAKGGYSPSLIRASADTPTILRVETKGTFDCSTALVINQINYRGYLPATGTTDIEIPPQSAGSTINGSCSMGMYSFRISFD